jgi:F-type H+-transporting ATPase subunit b
MPQISQLLATYASQIFWLLLTFGAVFLLVGRGVVPKVQATMADRDAIVAGDLAAAEAARAAADAQEDRWRAEENAARENAQKLIVEARARATSATEARLAEAGVASNARMAEAEGRIAAASAATLREIETVAAEAAQAIVSRVSGTQVSAIEAQAAVKAVLAHG